MGAPHSRHFPRSHSQLTSGKFSHIGIGFLHSGQNDRFGSLTDMPSGTRWMTTFKNDPMQAPIRNAGMSQSQ